MIFIGERERANLVVQLARFLYVPCLAHAQIYITSILRVGSSVLQLAGLRVVCGRLLLRRCSQLCMLLVCLYINNLYCNHRVLAQLLHHFCHTLVGSLPLANDVLHSASTCIGVHHILLYTCTLWADNTAYAEPMDCKSMLLLRDFISYYAGCTSYSL